MVITEDCYLQGWDIVV